MKSLVAGVLIVIVALASVLSCCHAERMGDGRDEYYDLIDWLSAVKRGSKVSNYCLQITIIKTKGCFLGNSIS